MLVNIVDDDDLVRQTMARCVTGEGWCVAIHGSAEAFLAAMDDLPFSCVVLDIRMPGMSGIELLQLLRERRPEWPVIMVTGSREIASAISSFRQGAVNFIQKPFKTESLLAAIREAADLGELRRAEATKRQELGIMRTLTLREREVLRALSEGLQSKTIAWQLGISARTVDMHRSNILTKLRARNASQAVAMAHRSGILDD